MAPEHDRDGRGLGDLHVVEPEDVTALEDELRIERDIGSALRGLVVRIPIHLDDEALTDEEVDWAAVESHLLSVGHRSGSQLVREERLEQRIRAAAHEAGETPLTWPGPGEAAEFVEVHEAEPDGGLPDDERLDLGEAARHIGEHVRQGLDEGVPPDGPDRTRSVQAQVRLRALRPLARHHEVQMRGRMQQFKPEVTGRGDAGEPPAAAGRRDEQLRCVGECHPAPTDPIQLAQSRRSPAGRLELTTVRDPAVAPDPVLRVHRTTLPAVRAAGQERSAHWGWRSAPVPCEALTCGPSRHAVAYADAG